MNVLKKHWPIVASILTLWLIIIILVLLTVGYNDGKLIYVLDDPYIHMTVAKNFAEHGTWGVSAQEFSSSSSSPLWTLLLTISYLIFGVNEIAPFILNILAASLLMLVAYILLRQYSSNPFYNFAILVILLWAAPLQTLVFTGLEHILHALIALLYLSVASKYIALVQNPNLATSKKSRTRLFVRLVILTPLLTAIRYEGLFMVLVVCLYLLFQRRIRNAIITGIISLIPPLLIGIISLAHGWYFLPNSVLLKGYIPDFATLKGVVNFILRDVILLFDTNVMIVLIIAALTLYLIFRFRKHEKHNEHVPALVIFLFTSWFHLQFADIGWYLRYEGYLVVLGIYAVAISLAELNITMGTIKDICRKKTAAIALLALTIVIIYPFFIRGAYPTYLIRRSSHNIYHQQYQMGLFLNRYYKNQAVALNDIGAAGFLGEIKPVDVWGMADKDIAQGVLEKSYTKELIDVVAKAAGARIAIVYDDIGRLYNSGGVPDNWRKVGRWTIPDNLACYNETVTFYAVDKNETDNLRIYFEEFSANLPEGVKWVVE